MGKLGLMWVYFCVLLDKVGVEKYYSVRLEDETAGAKKEVGENSIQ